MARFVHRACLVKEWQLKGGHRFVSSNEMGPPKIGGPTDLPLANASQRSNNFYGHVQGRYLAPVHGEVDGQIMDAFR